MLSDRLQQSQKLVRETLDPNFSWLINDEPTIHQLTKPLEESTIGYVTSCGVFRTDQQVPFDTYNNLGDPSFREIHIDTPKNRIGISHSHFDHKNALEDLSVIWPAEQLLFLKNEGFFNNLYPWFYSFMGYIPQTKQLIEDSAPVVAKRFAADKVDGIILTPG